MKITKEWLKENNACSESYTWLDKQKNKYWKSIANKLYKEEKFDWCFWLLYRKTIAAKAYLFSLLLLSILLTGVSLYLSIFLLKNESAAAIVVIAAVIAAIAVIAAGIVAAIVAAVAGAGIAFGSAVAIVVIVAAVAAVAGAGIAFVAFVAAVILGVAINEVNFLVKFGCKIAMQRSERG